MLQSLWLENLTRNESVPEDIEERWYKWSAEQRYLHCLKVPRHTVVSQMLLRMRMGIAQVLYLTIEHFSKLVRIKRCIAYCLRFIHNARLDGIQA